MSSLNKPQPETDTLDEAAVADFLQAHPDFFERHQQVLDGLKVPHRSGAAVSLVERQVATLRQKNLQLERKLRELVSVARSNEALADKVHQFARRLLAANSREDVIRVAEELLRSSFNAEHAVLVLFTGADQPPLAEQPVGERFLRLVDRDDPALGPFRTFLEDARARCGRIRDAQRSFLFPADADEIGSAALLPLGSGAEFGILAIGSSQADYFNPGQSLDFINRLGDLLGCALARR